MKVTKIDPDVAAAVMKLALEGSTRALEGFLEELSDQLSEFEANRHERLHERRSQRIEAILARQDNLENRAFLKDLIEVLEVFEETTPTPTPSNFATILSSTKKPLWEHVKGDFCYITNPEVLR
jgi:hypothetical protein